MTIQNIIADRRIEEVLHFTTNRGLTGILASSAVMPRKRLPEDKRLEYILTYNCPDRSRDVRWHDYVNLSVTEVNLHLFGISKGKWHSGTENWWCIVCFSPVVLEHSGVYFTTTNNIYTGVRRADGPTGLENMFADRVSRWQGNVVSREPSSPANQPTCNQAEVLYPGDLSLQYLEHVYVENEDNAASVESMADVFDGIPDFDCIVSPELFD